MSTRAQIDACVYADEHACTRSCTPAKRRAAAQRLRAFTMAPATVEDPELKEALASGEYERAFELLLGRVGDDPEGTRETMVALFGELGHEHPLSTQYRRRLAAALY